MSLYSERAIATPCERLTYFRVALSEARRKWVDDQVATAVGRSEQHFKFLAAETAARRRKEVNERASTGKCPRKNGSFCCIRVGFDAFVSLVSPSIALRHLLGNAIVVRPSRSRELRVGTPLR